MAEKQGGPRLSLSLEHSYIEVRSLEHPGNQSEDWKKDLHGWSEIA